MPDSQKFATAREIVTKHYQWMLKTDYLPRIAAAGVVNNVFNQGRKVFEVGAAPTDVPTMPIEFSVAGFRMGHSMVRAAYNWNRIFDDGFGSLELLFLFSATGGDLGGFQRLPSNWIADFRRLYDFGETPSRASRCPPASSTARCASTRPWSTRSSTCPPAASAAQRRVQRSATQPRLPQPHARPDGAAGDRAADGHLHEEQGRER